MCMCMEVCMSQRTCGSQMTTYGSLSPSSRGFCGLNSGHQTEWWAPLPAKLSPNPQGLVFVLFSVLTCGVPGSHLSLAHHRTWAVIWWVSRTRTSPATDTLGYLLWSFRVDVEILSKLWLCCFVPQGQGCGPSWMQGQSLHTLLQLGCHLPRLPCPLKLCIHYLSSHYLQVLLHHGLPKLRRVETWNLLNTMLAQDLSKVPRVFWWWLTLRNSRFWGTNPFEGQSDNERGFLLNFRFFTQILSVIWRY